MKKLLYSVYALLFNISRLLFPIKKNRVAFVSMHNENFKDSLGCVYEKMKEEGGYDFVLITRQDLSLRNIPRLISFFLVKSRLLATSQYVFLNDNFMPMGKLNFRPEAVITQLWHAEGAFKKFGLHIPQDEDLRKREESGNKKLTYVVCSSESVRDIYAGAFGVDREKVLPLGAPRADFLFKKENRIKAEEKLRKLYPQTKGKKVVLYAPTFRDDLKRNEDILKVFDTEKFTELLGEDYCLMVRLHPQIHINGNGLTNAIDVTDYEDVRELVLFCDILITDYSSICMDFSLLGKKTLFFAYDLEEYISERNFYFDYETYVPGEIAKTLGDLAVKVRGESDDEKNNHFRSFNFSFTDGKSSERVVERIVKKNE
ncbi:MAG: CDP-glycerol glycerophosphotransferase family protein [Clostridia bacterium]|nr:CDP-glycerol glycerophosphotransferase family protein [Clostridia bacterium]